jgi:hypothetical protein
MRWVMYLKLGKNHAFMVKAHYVRVLKIKVFDLSSASMMRGCLLCPDLNISVLI